MRLYSFSPQLAFLLQEEWVTYEDNLEKGYYLQDLLKEVVKERAEREAWNKQ